MREKLSNTFTKAGYRVEKICHIHMTEKARKEDIAIKTAAFWSLIADFLIFAPILPLGQMIAEFWTVWNGLALVFAVAIEIAYLFADLHPEADFGPYFDEDGYDEIGEPRGEDW